MTQHVRTDTPACLKDLPPFLYNGEHKCTELRSVHVLCEPIILADGSLSFNMGVYLRALGAVYAFAHQPRVVRRGLIEAATYRPRISCEAIREIDEPFIELAERYGGDLTSADLHRLARHMPAGSAVAARLEVMASRR